MIQSNILLSSTKYLGDLCKPLYNKASNMEELEKQSWTKATILSFIQHDLLLS